MIKCIAVDDEPLALEVIKAHCEKIAFVNLEMTFLSSVEAVEYMQNHKVDVVFLDINMPEISGLNMKTLIPESTQIVFITAYEEHALASYGVGATDYILKPVSFDRLYKAAQKCNEVQAKKGASSTAENEPSILVKSDKKVVQIAIREINYVEGLKDYAKIFYGDGKKEIIRESLKQIILELEPHGFLRVHRSFIIPLKKVDTFSGNIIVIGDAEIPISKAHRSSLVAIFKSKGILGDRSE